MNRREFMRNSAIAMTAAGISRMSSAKESEATQFQWNHCQELDQNRPSKEKKR